MKVIKLWGGLGNQMFQYAFGRAITNNCESELFFYQLDHTSDKDNLDILKFNVNIIFLKKDILKKHILFLDSLLLYRVERKILQILPFLDRNITIEPTLSYNEKIKNNHTSTIYDGYWQSYKYFANINDEILNEFEIREGFIQNSSLFKEIENSNSVSIHFRRGDYLLKKNKEVYASCERNYYFAAIKEISDKVNNPHFFVFSNDLPMAQKELTSLCNAKMVFVDNSKVDNGNLEDFLLMTKCKHNIIANSTFSWWAAWLNRNKEKVIIAPKKWYNGTLNDTTNDLIPKTWIRI